MKTESQKLLEELIADSKARVTGIANSFVEPTDTGLGEWSIGKDGNEYAVMRNGKVLAVCPCARFANTIVHCLRFFEVASAKNVQLTNETIQ